MVQIILEIDGMACGMCEAHVNDAIRRAFPVKKVTSSHKKGRTEILSESPLEEAAVRDVLEGLGYHLLRMDAVPYAKKGFFR